MHRVSRRPVLNQPNLVLKITQETRPYNQSKHLSYRKLIDMVKKLAQMCPIHVERGH